MSISTTLVAVPEPGQFNAETNLSFYVIGDGTSTSISIDLTLPPFSLNLKGNPPSAVTSASYSGGSVTATTTIDRYTLTINFATAPSAETQISAVIRFAYNGV